MAEIEQDSQDGEVPHGFIQAPPTVLRGGQQATGLEQLDRLQQAEQMTDNGQRIIQAPGGQQYLAPKPNPLHDWMLNMRLAGVPWRYINNAASAHKPNDTALSHRLGAMTQGMRPDNGPAFLQLPGGGDERG